MDEHIKLTTLEDVPDTQEGDETIKDISYVPHAMTVEAHQNVLDLVGRSMEEEATLQESMQPKKQKTQPQPVMGNRKEQKEQDDQWRMNVLLDRIMQLAHRLMTASQEHRARNFIDILPIYGNIRSFKRATKEGDLIQEMQQVMMELRFLAERSDLPMHLEEVRALHEAINALTIPGGITKITASIFPSMRSFHRDLTTPRTEAVQDKASALSRSLSTQETRTYATAA